LIHWCRYKLNQWASKIVEREVVAMICRYTISIPEGDIVLLRLLHCDLRWSQTGHRCCLALSGLLSVLPGAHWLVVGASRFDASTPRCTWRPLHWSSQLRDMTIMGFWSDNSQILPEGPRDKNALCWWLWSLVFWWGSKAAEWPSNSPIKCWLSPWQQESYSRPPCNEVSGAPGMCNMVYDEVMDLGFRYAKSTGGWQNGSWHDFYLSGSSYDKKLLTKNVVMGLPQSILWQSILLEWGNMAQNDYPRIIGNKWGWCSLQRLITVPCCLL